MTQEPDSALSPQHVAPASSGHVYFIGAGPGAPDLLTLRGKALIERADVVLYADSLVDPRLTEFARPDAEIVGSAGLTLEELTERIVQAALEGKQIARLQSGDPSIYGAMHEQIVRLNAAGVAWTIVPGVSSAFAAAAVLGVELTVPEIAQTVIMTRISGKASPVPQGEDLRSLAAHGATLVLFLSITHIARVVQELMEGGYPPETPVAGVYRATWPDEEILRGSLAGFREQVRAARWTRQALILVGPALAEIADDDRRSRLYAGDFSHLFRTARSRPR
jgi:precorrin-4/cobalt-precorrin-4 C11-methyltransferase